MINKALEIDIWPFHGDVDCSGSVDAVDIQRVINTVLGIKVIPAGCDGWRVVKTEMNGQGGYRVGAVGLRA